MEAEPKILPKPNNAVIARAQGMFIEVLEAFIVIRHAQNAKEQERPIWTAVLIVEDLVPFLRASHTL